jgi:hypothetical protein
MRSTGSKWMMAAAAWGVAGMMVVGDARGQSLCLAEMVEIGSVTKRSRHAMAYDAARGVTVLFGGMVPGPTNMVPNNETWEWDGVQWLLRSVTGPSPRSGHVMVYDSHRGVVTLYGGSTSLDPAAVPPHDRDETWEWDGDQWTLVATVGPGGKRNTAMAFDSVRGRTVLFGGSAPSGGPLYTNDLWEWDGSTWMQIVAPGPSDRSGHNMTFDPVRSATVMYGGYRRNERNFGVRLQDTWLWDGYAWSLAATTGPIAPSQPGSKSSGLSSHSMAFDSTRGVVLLYGGTSGGGVTNHLWEWNGSTWSQVQYLTAAPMVREQVEHGFVFDGQRNAAVLFGGFDQPSMLRLDDTWEFQFRNSFRVLPVQGSCPGGMQLTAQHATPFGDVHFYVGNQTGSSSVTITGCGRTTLPIKGGVTLLGTVQADAQGTAVFNFNLTSGCTRKMVVVDVGSCTVSRVIDLN